MDDKDRITLNKKEQMDIMTDPFALEIISAMNYENVATKKEIADNLGEDLKLISEYFDKMLKTGFMLIDEEKSTKDKKYYKMAAKSLSSSDDMMYSKEMKEFWISGFINFLENSMIDFFDYMENIDDNKLEHLKKIGYYEKVWADFSPIYLSKEEAEEVQEMVKEYIYQKIDEKRKDNNKYRPYYFFTFLFPNVKRSKN